MSTTTAQTETKLPAEYRVVDGVQTMKIAGSNVSIYFIPAGETTIEVTADERLTVVHGTIRHEKNQFVPNTSFLVCAGTVRLTCDKPAAFRRGD
jgi:hypothetical protein